MKDFIPYKEALALKELGFNEPCLAVYNDPDFKWARHLNGWEDSELESVINSIYAEGGFVTAPTFSQAFRFFREKYDISSFVKRDFRDRKVIGYYFGIEGTKEDFYSKSYITFEEAELECLRRLISVVS